MAVKESRNIISEVVPNSKAAKAGVEKGDRLLSINEELIEDIIEYMFLIAEEEIEIEIEKKDGRHIHYHICKDYDEDLGINFENPIIDEAKSCRNKCMFCFIDQLPPGMRETLYFKDDDSRLSFLQGNFITLTNMSERDIDKIIRYRISPINISIHTTDPELRKKMLHNKNAGDIMERLKKLSQAEIFMQGQIVLCPKVNDGFYLDKTIGDLSALYPYMTSIAVVPVGLTKFREGLYQLEGYHADTAKKVIKQAAKWQELLITKIGTRFVFLSDEFYIQANEEIPNYESYEGFPQLENGVGLMAKLKKEIDVCLQNLRDKPMTKHEVSVVTGVSAAGFLEQICKEIESHFTDLRIHVYPIKNTFFGESITVSGLITGRDIVNQLKNKELGQKLILPVSMFKAGERIFLDDYTLEEVTRKLKIDIEIAQIDGKDFVEKILSNTNSMEV